MTNFVLPLRPEKVWLRREFLFDDQKDDRQYYEVINYKVEENK